MQFHGNSITKSFISDNLHLHVNNKKQQKTQNKYEEESTSKSPQCGNVKCKFAGKRQTHIPYTYVLIYVSVWPTVGKCVCVCALICHYK